MFVAFLPPMKVGVRSTTKAGKPVRDMRGGVARPYTVEGRRQILLAVLRFENGKERFVERPKIEWFGIGVDAVVDELAKSFHTLGDRGTIAVCKRSVWRTTGTVRDREAP